MIAPGTRLGPYVITASIGAGGMGEVYRARDTKLNRDVALKVLPAAFTHDVDRLARFTREAHLWPHSITLTSPRSTPATTDGASRAGVWPKTSTRPSRQMADMWPINRPKAGHTRCTSKHFRIVAEGGKSLGTAARTHTGAPMGESSSTSICPAV